ncbi:MAG TPA: response regulator, partial [Malonomonas sp.]
MKRVLIVDDEKSFLLSLKDGLSAHSNRYQVVTAGNGREAVELLRAQPIDLLVTDLKLPEMDGFELLAWVSRHKAQLPVIVMTAFGTPEIEARLATMDALQYLEKPLDLQMLQEGIDSGLEAGAKSYIRGITLATFLQLMSIEQKNCTLKVTAGGSTGYLYISRGELRDAEYNALCGEAAALEIVGWENAEIEMDGICRRQEAVINLSLEHILIEAFRRKDEQAYRKKQQLEVSAEPAQLKPAEPPSALARQEERSRSVSAEQLTRKRLAEVLTKLAPVQEFVIFDTHSFLEEKNAGVCTIDDFDPALYTHLVEQIDAQICFGSFSYLCLNTASRYRYLLLRSQQHRVLAKLKPGTQPQQVVG